MIDKALKERIYTWNRDRGLTKFNANLEIKLLSEECNEFYMACDPAHIVQEYCDFLFVSYGTEFKIGCITYDSMPKFEVWYSQCEDLFEFISVIKNEMYRRVEGVIENYIGYSGYDFERDLTIPDEIINKALLYVIEANEAKSAEKDHSGKIVKGDKYISPYDRIKDTLDFYESKYVSDFKEE
jgi:hypothetical protein